VTIKTNTKVTPKILKEEKPDVVILATGSEPLIPKIPGIENCVLAEDVFAGKVNVGNNIVIIGGGLVGCELALKLAEEGKKVTIVEALPLLARDEPRQCRLAILRLLQKLEVNILTNSPVVEIRRDSVDIVDNLGKRTTIYADTIVLSVGRIKRLDNGLLESAKSITNEVYIIGDAMKPRKIKDAIREGFWTAISI
jgi:2,4-dienoyl-CoA reductase (NADPH2)